MELLLTILSIICSFVAIVISYYFHIRKILEQEALDAINKAEETDKIGKEKMELAIDTVYNGLPAVVKPFVTRVLLETIIQAVFDKVEEYAQKQVKEN